MITNATEIQDSIKLIECIQRVAGVEFKRSGVNMMGISPFVPDEKSASFSVNERKGIYKCFSSGKGGNNAVTFLMQYKNLTYPQALIEIAEMTGETVVYDNGITREEAVRRSKAERDAKEMMMAAIKKAHAFMSGKWESEKGESGKLESGKVEVAGKSYSVETWKKWGLLVAGESNSLSKASKTWAERPQLIDAGLLAPSKHGGEYDFFHSRLLFPLFDRNMQVIGYNGRIIKIDESKKVPKYINSPDSIVYKKGSYLYGLTQNHRNISDNNLCQLVEGPTDVIMMDEHGINNAVCSMGTALTLDQAKNIAVHTDTVIIAYDGDEAGKKATVKAIKTLIMAQLEAKVKVLPKEHDPGSFVAQFGKDAYQDLPVVDGIEWVLDLELPKGAKDAGPHEKSGAMITIANLIADINDESVRNQYISTLAKKLDTTVAALKDAVKSVINDRLESKNRLTPEQDKQKMLWGIYKDHNVYRNHNGHEIANFVIDPLFLLTYQDKAYRIFELINKYGFKKIININTDDFSTLSGFRKASERNNFIFKGNDADFLKVREWVYNEMKEVKPIEVLGYQPKYGIYAWANGIAHPNSSNVIEVDDYGIVDYKDDSMEHPVSFFLPAGVKLLPTDDEDNDRELESHFVYDVPATGSKAPKSLSEWSAGFAKVFGKNSVIGLCWTIAAIHRDMLHKRYDMFPHLNLFGPAGSGKTFMAQVITSIFGKPMRAVHLVSSSPVAFYRRIAQTRNAIVWYEEYSEKVTGDKQEALKNFADGFGRVTGQMTNNNKTKSTPVLNACIISGQILPSHDPALLERCVTLFFDKYVEHDKRKSGYGQDFKEWGNSGIFSYVAAEIFSHRDYVADKFADKMDDVRDQLRAMFTSSTMPGDRVLNNFAMIASVYLIIADKVKLPFSISEVLDVIADRILEQSKSVEGADELSGWWQVIEYLITKDNEVRGHGLGQDHYSIEMEKSVRIKVSESETKTIEWDTEQKLLFLRLNHAHSLYTREGKSMVSRVVEKGTLMHYMKQHRSWVGEMKGKRWPNNGPIHRCLVFNLNELPALDLECTYFKNNNDVIADILKSNNPTIEFNFPENGNNPFA